MYNAVPTADDLPGPIGALACGFAAAYVGQQATTALNQGKCIGMRALIYVPMSTTHLVIEPCRDNRQEWEEASCLTPSSGPTFRPPGRRR